MLRRGLLTFEPEHARQASYPNRGGEQGQGTLPAELTRLPDLAAIAGADRARRMRDNGHRPARRHGRELPDSAARFAGAHPAWGYALAFTEAAMVGGLADWFAVTALFRHPLGLPIPHTAIIPRNKDRIASTMAAFLRENFLTPQVIARRTRGFNFAGVAGTFLTGSGTDDQARLRAGAANMIADVLESLEPRAARRPGQIGPARPARKARSGAAARPNADGRHCRPAAPARDRVHAAPRRHDDRGQRGPDPRDDPRTRQRDHALDGT